MGAGGWLTALPQQPEHQPHTAPGLRATRFPHFTRFLDLTTPALALHGRRGQASPGLCFFLNTIRVAVHQGNPTTASRYSPSHTPDTSEGPVHGLPCPLPLPRPGGEPTPPTAVSPSAAPLFGDGFLHGEHYKATTMPGKAEYWGIHPPTPQGLSRSQAPQSWVPKLFLGVAGGLWTSVCPLTSDLQISLQGSST